jgi:hypothetical protein
LSFFEEAKDANYPAEYLKTVQAAYADLDDSVVYAIDASRDYELIYIKGDIWGAKTSDSAFFKHRISGYVWFEQVCLLMHISSIFLLTIK